MKIEWSIIKKRGNLRPLLNYKVSLEEHEKNLAVPPVSIVSTIPRPKEDWQEHCYPGQYERNEREEVASACEFYTLEAPSHKGHAWTRVLRLPWRENNLYPEVEASFDQLRQELENELQTAHASLPMQKSGALQTSASGKTAIAPGILADRFLRIASNGS
jgi:hypothetical protein